MKAAGLKRLYLILLAPAAAILTWAAKRWPDFAEWYACYIYPWFAKPISFITSLVPFSIAELLVIALIPGIIAYVVVLVVRLRRDKPRAKKILLRFTATLAACVSSVYFLFTIFCGINYYRYTFADYSGIEMGLASAQELLELCEALAAEANALAELLPQDESGITRLPYGSYYEAAEAAGNALDLVAGAYGNVLAVGNVRPKPVMLSALMSNTQITGVFFPFTFEANVNVHVPDYTIPVTMCHEISHLSGFMREDEANFIAFLACWMSEEPAFSYSGVMLALTYSMNALYSKDYDLYQQAYNQYSSRVIADLAGNRAYWSQYSGVVAVAASMVNDSYLRANSQDDGVESYGRMVDLLLGYYRQGGLEAQ